MHISLCQSHASPTDGSPEMLRSCEGYLEIIRTAVAWSFLWFETINSKPVHRWDKIVGSCGGRPSILRLQKAMYIYCPCRLITSIPAPGYTGLHGTIATAMVVSSATLQSHGRGCNTASTIGACAPPSSKLVPQLSPEMDHASCGAVHNEGAVHDERIVRVANPRILFVVGWIYPSG